MVFSIFIDNLNDGLENMIIKFANVTHGRVNRESIMIQEEPDKQQQWQNLARFNFNEINTKPFFSIKIHR